MLMEKMDILSVNFTENLSKFVSASSVSGMLSLITSNLLICIINYTDLFTYTVWGYFVC